MDKLDYIIVQAGGKGTRLGYLTVNKPKCLVPVGGKPILFHLFGMFPESHFIILGDYKIDVLKRYLRTFASVNYEIINAGGFEKTCAGLRAGLNMIPEDRPFMYIWSDLVLAADFQIPDLDHNWIGVSRGFPCRWSYEHGKIVEKPSDNDGIAGCFIFKNKKEIQDVPLNGAFVRWLGTQNIEFNELPLIGTREIGVLEEYQKHAARVCRPFNNIEITDNYVVKEPVDKQGEQLAAKERSWYKFASKKGIAAIPQIYSFAPLVMEKISGMHPYEAEADRIRKVEILKAIMKNLAAMHSVEKKEADIENVKEAYLYKTLARLEKIKNLVPFFDDNEIRINGKLYPNMLKNFDAVECEIEKEIPENFCIIHGDCTFSNTFVCNNNIKFIDPRGYFGKITIFGDPAYDYAKLYYSLIGNYDQFNLNNFKLAIFNDAVELKIDSNGWEDVENVFWENLPSSISSKKIKLLHSLIWLSLTTYAWDDYDKVCGAFYKGISLLGDI